MAPKPKLTPAQIAAAKARLETDPELSQAAVASELGIDASTLSRALDKLEPPDAPITMLTLMDIRVGKLNPRKTFDETSIAELAASIAANGLLQNLVVRPTPGESGVYELIAGERRWRAIRHLHDLDQWDLATRIPCRVITADAGAHLALALLENLQRQDVPPLEEADAFAQLQALDPAVWTTSIIAARIGRTARYVYQRLALVKKLAPESRAALASGRLNIEAARLLTTTSPKIQADMLTRRKDNVIKASDLEWELRGTLFETSDAIFDVAAADLEVLEANGVQYFEDRTAAGALQMAAVKTKADELKKKWQFVKVLKPGEQFNSWLWTADKTKAQGGGAIIEVNKNTFEVHIHEGWIKKETKAEPAYNSKEAQAAREASAEKAAAKRHQELIKRRTALMALTHKLPSDYPEYEAAALDPNPAPDDYEEDAAATGNSPSCADGCKFRAYLANPYQWNGFYLCTRPDGPRAGLLTYQHQAGATCFEAKK